MLRVAVGADPGEADGPVLVAHLERLEDALGPAFQRRAVRVRRVGHRQGDVAHAVAVAGVVRADLVAGRQGARKDEPDVALGEHEVDPVAQAALQPGGGDLREPERLAIEERRLRGVADPQLDVVDAVQRHEICAVSVHDCPVVEAISVAKRCGHVASLPSVDAIDRQIVALMRQDARRSFQSIGVRVSLSAPAVKRRVDRLEAEGVLRGYTALVDPGRFGWGTHAVVALFCEGRMAAAEVREALEHHPEVEAAYTVAGEASAMLHVRARDTSHLEEALERIRDEPGVTRTQTQIVLSTLFERPFDEAVA